MINYVITVRINSKLLLTHDLFIIKGERERKR